MNSDRGLTNIRAVSTLNVPWFAVAIPRTALRIYTVDNILYRARIYSRTQEYIPVPTIPQKFWREHL